MRQNVKEFVRVVSATLPIPEPIYEFGSFQVDRQLGFADLRPLFPNKEYVGCDMREGPGVDKILDLHDIGLPSGSVGTVLCLDTLEHVEYPRKALEEIHRILKPDGVVVITSVMDFRIHDRPHDYWRFTPEAFKSILKSFSNSFVGFQGKENFPHTIVGVGSKSDAPLMSEFIEKYDAWQRAEKKSIKKTLLSFIPPILVPLLRSLYRAVPGRKKQA